MMATGKPIPEVAKDYGYSKFAFYRAINGETKSKKVRAIISSLVNKDPEEIWPEQQTENCEIINKTVTEPREQQNA